MFPLFFVYCSLSSVSLRVVVPAHLDEKKKYIINARRRFGLYFSARALVLANSNLTHQRA